MNTIVERKIFTPTILYHPAPHRAQNEYLKSGFCRSVKSSNASELLLTSMTRVVRHSEMKRASARKHVSSAARRHRRQRRCCAFASRLTQAQVNVERIEVPRRPAGLEELCWTVSRALYLSLSRPHVRQTHTLQCYPPPSRYLPVSSVPRPRPRCRARTHTSWHRRWTFCSAPRRCARA
jgi:hypothetical protein